MSDYLARLAERSLQTAREVQPQFLSNFEKRTAAETETADVRAEVPSETLEQQEPSLQSSRSSSSEARLEKMQALWPPQPPVGSASSMSSLPRESADFTVRATVATEVPSLPNEATSRVSKRPAFPADVLPNPAAEVGSAPVNSPPPSVPPLSQQGVIASSLTADGNSAQSLTVANLGDTHRKSTPENRDPAPPLLPPPAIRSQRAVLPAEPLAPAAKRHNSAESELRKESEPRVIQITIGRLEIRAAPNAPRPDAARRSAVPKAMALDEYLRRPAAGGRP